MEKQEKKTPTGKMRAFVRGMLLGAAIVITLNSMGHIITVRHNTPETGYTEAQRERLEMLLDK